MADFLSLSYPNCSDLRRLVKQCPPVAAVMAHGTLIAGRS
jgi:hypothetical protein